MRRDGSCGLFAPSEFLLRRTACCHARIHVRVFLGLEQDGVPEQQMDLALLAMEGPKRCHLPASTPRSGKSAEVLIKFSPDNEEPLPGMPYTPRVDNVRSGPGDAGSMFADVIG